MKKLIMPMALCSLLLASCNDSNTQLSRQTETLMQEANAQVGMPAIKNFQEKKLMKQIYEMRDNANLITYTYIVAENTGQLIFLGKSIGFGLPYAAQFSNPQKDYSQNYSMPQAEPNGLFMPNQADGTWVMLLDKSGQPHPLYIEPRVIISPFPLQ